MLDDQIISVKKILELEANNQKIEVKGWIRNKRGSKKTSFLSINDGSTINTLQVIAEGQIINEATIKDITTGCCVQICLLYTSPSPRDRTRSRMPSSA